MNYNDFIQKEIPALADWLTEIGLTADSFWHASAGEMVDGYWRETIRVKWSADGISNLDDLPEDIHPDGVLFDKINAQLRAAKFPAPVKIQRLDDADGDISQFLDAPADYQFVTRDADDNILMLRARVDKLDGTGKTFPSWVPCEFDGEISWLKTGYPGLLPLFGMENAKDGKAFLILEGERKVLAARNIAKNCPTHPFYAFLNAVTPVAFQGGAHAVARADWADLNRFLGSDSTVYVWPDNDHVSIESVPTIAKNLRSKVVAILPSDDCFPVGWDIANDIPESLMRNGVYVGPSIDEMKRPASWLTYKLTLLPEPGSRAKPKEIIKLRDNVKREWIYCAKDGLFAHANLPIELDAETLDLKLRPFSDTRKVSDLFAEVYSGDVDRIAYRPDAKPRQRILDRATGDYGINTFRPAKIEARQGDVTPFLEFMDYLVPDDKERIELLRWAATMVSKPEIKTPFAVILSSITQGTGKTLFSSKIMAPLVGSQNVEFLKESSLTSEFNGWWFQKRLAIASELHIGGIAAYNALKAIVTDDQVPLRKLYQEQTTRENWCQILINSNDAEPIKIPPEDRRWLCVAATEDPWPKEKFSGFIAWLNNGGLEIVKWFFDNFSGFAFAHSGHSDLRPVYGKYYRFAKNAFDIEGSVSAMKYLNESEAPAGSALKDEIVESSMTWSQRVLSAAFAKIANDNRPIVVFDSEVVSWLQSEAEMNKVKIWEKPKTVRNIASKLDKLSVGKIKIKKDNRTMYAIANKRALEKLDIKSPDDAENDALRAIGEKWNLSRDYKVPKF
ncbi:DUF5906 domain-containing protein [Martelella sp. AMO21009]